MDEAFRKYLILDEIQVSNCRKKVSQIHKAIYFLDSQM